MFVAGYYVVFGAIVSYPVYNEVRTGEYNCYLNRDGVDEYISLNSYRNLRLSDYSDVDFAYCYEIVDRFQIDSIQLTSTTTDEI